MERFRDYLVRRRSELRYSQVDLAKSAGIPSATIAAIEAGRVTKAPRIDTLEKLAKGLRVDPQVLISLARGEEPSVSKHPSELSPEERDRIGREWLSEKAQQYDSRYQELIEEARQAAASGDKKAQARIAAEVEYLSGETDQLLGIQRMLDLEENSLNPLAGGLEPPGDISEPPDEWEIELLRKIGSDTDLGDLDPRRGGYLWYLPKDRRRRTLIHMEEIWDEHQAYKERHPKKDQGAG